MRKVLRDVLARTAKARKAGLKPLVLFDLDDTVLATVQRHLRIMAEFASERPEAAALLAVKPKDVRYSVAETAKGAGLADEELVAELRRFWGKRFFRDDYLLADEPVPGAPAYCRRVAARGGVPVYFTGRDERMRRGTLASLARHGFPAPGREAWLVLKESFDIPDLEYKGAGLRALLNKGDVVAGFENEPAHINLFHDLAPGAVNVFVDTRHSGKPVVVKAHLPVIKDFLPA